MTAREAFAAAVRRQQAASAVAAKKAASGATASPRRETIRRKRTPQEGPPPEGMVSVREFAAARGLSETGIFRAIAEARLSSVKHGHCRYIDPAEYDRYREAGRANRQAAAARAQIGRKAAAARRRAARCATETPTP